MARALLSTLAILAVLPPGVCAAQAYGRPADPGADKRLSLELQTQAPLMAGGGLTFRTKKGMRLGAMAGVLPQAYVSAINATATSLDLYPEETADLIETILARSLVLMAQVGWGGADGGGFFVDLGYALVTLGGSSGAQEVLTALTDSDVPDEVAGESAQFAIDSTLHMVRVEAGWIWRLGPRLDLKASLGGAFTIGARTTVTPPDAEGRARVKSFRERLSQDAQHELDTTYTRDVHSPTVGLSLSWRAL